VKNSANRKQNQLDPFWNAILAGTVVALFLLAILPSSKVDFIYRVKTVATQHRLDALQNQVNCQPKFQLPDDSSVRDAGIRVLAAKEIESTPPKVAAVLSTQHSLPRRFAAEVTFLADRRYLTDEIQVQLEAISLNKVKSDEILLLQQRKRALEWEITSAQHLVDQLETTDDAAEPFKVVSTNPVDLSTLQQDWKSVIASKKELFNQIVDQIRSTSARASGFVAVAGKPQVFPRVARSISMSTIVAFIAGAMTSCLFFLLLRFVMPKVGASRTREKSRREQNTASGLRLAGRIAGLGIPYLGAIEANRAATSNAQHAGKGDASARTTTEEVTHLHTSQFDLPGVAHLRSTPGESIVNHDKWNVPLQRSLEWLLVLWMATAAIRFFSDDVWRSLVLQSPLTGLAKLFSGIA